MMYRFFFFKQKTAYEMRISDWSSDVCSSDLAVALAHAPRFLDGGLHTPVHFCFSYDEEVGCKGVPSLLAFLARQPVKPAMCVVGEPTGMKVITGHKGKSSIRCHVRGKEAHSSLAPYGVNAVNAAARVVNHLADMAARKAAEGPFDPAFAVPYQLGKASCREKGWQYV